ncbi:hypothetical protein [Halalkalibacterium ligniniphilum]|uniref:hypothetical protein n=1 Tax=Halalkalibacterium ligniniphilum TaxID=1134413 RepID=UPI00034A58CC|nr:hypothetical protein [Halalkalibacterium ligniniphilum]
MRVVSCDPLKQPTIETVDSFSEVNQRMAGDMKVLSFHVNDSFYALVCHKEGVLHCNSKVKKLYGTFILCQQNESGELEGLTEEEASTLHFHMTNHGFELEQITI